MNYKSLIVISLTALVLAGCGGTKKSTTSSSVKKGGVQFVKSPTLSAVLDQAEQTNKLVFVDFYTTWCTPCKMMDKDVFSDKAIGDFFSENFISYKVDAEKGNGINLAVVYQVSAYPTLFFLDEKGRILESKQGAAYHTELMQMARRAINSRHTLQ